MPTQIELKPVKTVEIEPESAIHDKVRDGGLDHVQERMVQADQHDVVDPVPRRGRRVLRSTCVDVEAGHVRLANKSARLLVPAAGA